MAPYVKSLLATSSELSRMGITWGYSNEYSSHVGDAREITLNGGYDNNPFDSTPFKGEITYDKIMWIDSDIAWTPDDFIRLYESDKDIVAGAYLLANGTVVAHKERFGKPFIYEEVKELEELEQVFMVGLGFVCVKQGVFESLSRPWFQSVQATIKDPNTNKDFPFFIMGEDVSWCSRVNDAGYEIWLDPKVKVTHHKNMRLTWEGIK